MREEPGSNSCLPLFYKIEVKTFLLSGSSRSSPRLPGFLCLSKPESKAIKLRKYRDLGKGKTVKLAEVKRLGCSEQSIALGRQVLRQWPRLLRAVFSPGWSWFSRHLVRPCAKNCLGLLDTLINKIVKGLCPRKTYSLTNRQVRKLNS